MVSRYGCGLKKYARMFGLIDRGYPAFVNFNKIDLIDFIFNNLSPSPQTFADLGGVWGVDAAYTFYIMKKYKINQGTLIDTNFTDSVLSRQTEFPNLHLLQGNFGDKKIIDQLENIDVVLLFDVLLHQVGPNWDELLAAYTKKTKLFCIFQPQWVKSKTTVRLLDLGKDDYFANTPHDPCHPTYKALFEKMYEINPEHNRIWRDVHNVWQWGISDKDLVDVMEKLGFSLKYHKNCGQFGTLVNFENHAFVFEKQMGPK